MKNNDLDGLKSVDLILNKIVKDLGIERGLKESTLTNLWPEIIGSRFKDKTKAVSVINKGSYSALLVAVSSPVISQELFLFKKDILKKVSIIAVSLGFNIKDIIFNTQIWDSTQIINKTQEDEDETIYIFHKNPSDKELQDIKVSEDIVESIKESVKSQEFSSPELKDRILHTIIRDIKTKIWRKNNGFPCCSNCGIPINYYSRDEKNLCPACKYSD